jgi:multidrug resistance efflux pump
MDTRAIWDLIAQRAATATAAVETLRAQIAALSEQLARAESELADLATTRRTLMALTGEPDPAPQGDATIASVAYQQILAAFTTATGGMRAKDVCLALGLGTTPKDTEGLRAKLKRLVTRQILVESEPGLFALAAATPSTQDHEQER